MYTFILLIYSLVSAITIAGTFLSLDLPFVFGITLVIFVLCRRFLSLPTSPTKLPYRSLTWIFLLLLYFLVFQIQEEFIGGQDARSHHLPMARLLAEDKLFPTQWLDVERPFVAEIAGYPQTHTGLGAMLFLVSNRYEGWVASIVPIIFFTAFIFVCFLWYEEEGGRPIVLAYLFLLSPLFIERSSWFGCETPLIFSTTLLLYLLYKDSKESGNGYVELAILASAMALLSKYTGVLFTVFLMFYVVRKYGLAPRLWLTLIIIHSPCAIWYLRNYWYTGTPVPPLLSVLITDPVIRESFQYYSRLSLEYGYINWKEWVMQLLLLPALPAWAILFPFVPEMRRNPLYTRIYILMILFLILWLSWPDMRYLMPFYSTALILLGLWLQKKLPEGIFGINPALVYILLFGLQILYVQKIFPDHISPQREALKILKDEQVAHPDVRLFTDTDHILTWEGRYTVFVPTCPVFSRDFYESRERGDIVGLLHKYNVKYVVNHPFKAPWEDVFDKIRKNKQNFSKVYGDRDSGVEIWKVLY